MLDGQWLYVGAVEHKPPLIASAYAMVLGVAGRQGIHTVHAVSILVVVATALVIGLLARRLGTGRAAARAASAVYVFWASIGPAKDMLAANGELLMALPAVAALAIALPGLGARPGRCARTRADARTARSGAGAAMRCAGWVPARWSSSRRCSSDPRSRDSRAAGAAGLLRPAARRSSSRRAARRPIARAACGRRPRRPRRAGGLRRPVLAPGRTAGARLLGLDLPAALRRVARRRHGSRSTRRR